MIQPTRRSARSPRPFAPLAAVLLTLALAACDSGETTVRRVYEVAPQKVVCQGVGMQLCLQVREPGEEAWTLMYTAPEGFVFQWGLAARIVVEERTTEPVALDAGSLRRTLVEVERRDTLPADTPFTLHIPGGPTGPGSRVNYFESLIGYANCPYSPVVDPQQEVAPINTRTRRGVAAPAAGTTPVAPAVVAMADETDLRCRELDRVLDDPERSVLLTLRVRRNAALPPAPPPSFSLPPRGPTFWVVAWEACDSRWPVCER